jgi:hypothetical protein
MPIDVTDAKNEDAAFWKAFDSQAKNSVDEELLMEDFPPVHMGRDVLLFNDEDKLL